MPPLSAAVLAGGRSSRMGRDKYALRLGGERLIERVVGRLSVVSDDLLVAGATVEEMPFLAGRLRFTTDPGGPGQGPLAGIAGALAAARHDHLLVVATDMPFLNPDLIRFLASLATDVDVVVPVIAADGFPETLHAIYHRAALPAIERALQSGRRRVTSFFPEVRVRTVTREELLPYDPQLHAFFNANTPEEWERARRIDAGEPEA